MAWLGPPQHLYVTARHAEVSLPWTPAVVMVSTLDPRARFVSLRERLATRFAALLNRHTFALVFPDPFERRCVVPWATGGTHRIGLDFGSEGTTADVLRRFNATRHVAEACLGCLPARMAEVRSALEVGHRELAAELLYSQSLACVVRRCAVCMKAQVLCEPCRAAGETQWCHLRRPCAACRAVGITCERCALLNATSDQSGACAGFLMRVEEDKGGESGASAGVTVISPPPPLAPPSWLTTSPSTARARNGTYRRNARTQEVPQPAEKVAHLDDERGGYLSLQLLAALAGCADKARWWRGEVGWGYL